MSGQPRNHPVFPYHACIIGQSLNNTLIFINQLFNGAVVRHTKYGTYIPTAFYYRFRLTPRICRIINIDNGSIN
jgi:hypothetical protein